MSIERMTELTKQIETLTAERQALGRSLPPVTLDEVKNDPYFEAHVREWMRTWMPSIDTTLLDRDDLEKWERLTQPYEVEEVEGVFHVRDRLSGTLLEDSYESERDADEALYELLSEWEEGLYGFPFAWNTGWVLEGKWWLDELTAAGFLVYDYEGTIIAGIDGGGYAFMDAHFAPLLAALAEKNEWLVETKHGPRRITTTKEVTE